MKLDINSLSVWQQQVFAAALMQRMLPNYAYFSNETDFGDYQLLQNQVDIIWQKLSLLSIKFNAEIQIEKLQNNIPNQNDFDIFAVYPAIDVCSGLISLLESFEEKETRCAFDLSLLSINSVHAFLTLQLQQKKEQELQQEVSEESIIESNPLYIWELETQQELFDMIITLNSSKANCQKIKAWIMDDRLTNLAIEY